MAQDLAALAAKMGGVSSPTGIDFAKLAQQNGGTSTAPTASGSPSSAPASFSVNPDARSRFLPLPEGLKLPLRRLRVLLIRSIPMARSRCRAVVLQLLHLEDLRGLACLIT